MLPKMVRFAVIVWSTTLLATVIGTPTHYHSVRSLDAPAWVGFCSNNTISQRDCGDGDGDIEHRSRKRTLLPRTPVKFLKFGSSSDPSAPGDSIGLVKDPKGKGKAQATPGEYILQPGQHTIPIHNYGKANLNFMAHVVIKDIEFRLHVDTGVPDTTIYSEDALKHERQKAAQEAPSHGSQTLSDTAQAQGSQSQANSGQGNQEMKPKTRVQYLEDKRGLYPSRDDHDRHGRIPNPEQFFDLTFADEGGGSGHVVIEDTMTLEGGQPIIRNQHIGVYDVLREEEPVEMSDGTLGLGSARFGSIFQFRDTPDGKPGYVKGQRNWLETHELERTNGVSPGIFTLDLIHSKQEKLFQPPRKSFLTIGTCLCSKMWSVPVNTGRQFTAWLLPGNAPRPSVEPEIFTSDGTESGSRKFLIDERNYEIDSGSSFLTLYPDQVKDYYQQVEAILKNHEDPGFRTLEVDAEEGEYHIPCDFDGMPDFTIPGSNPPIVIPGVLLVTGIREAKDGYCTSALAHVVTESASANKGTVSQQFDNGGGSGSKQKRAVRAPLPDKSNVHRPGRRTSSEPKGIALLGLPFFMAYTVCFEFAPDTGDSNASGKNKPERIHKRVVPGEGGSASADSTVGWFHYCEKDAYLAPKAAVSAENKATQESGKKKGCCRGCACEIM